MQHLNPSQGMEGSLIQTELEKGHEREHFNALHELKESVLKVVP